MNLIHTYFWAFSIFLLPVLYIVTASVFYLVLYKWKRKAVAKYRIQELEPDFVQFRRELHYSIISLLIFSVTGGMVFLLYHYGYSRIYFELQTYGILYALVSVILYVLVYDMYFYWTHRLLHLNGWYQKVHQIHHLSSSPSPFTSLSFHPLESAIQAMALPFIILLIPVHPYSLLAFLLILVYKNVRGHSGYEFTSQSYRAKRWNSWYFFAVHHDDHHQQGKYNYGLFFNFWDRLMGTYHRNR